MQKLLFLFLLPLIPFSFPCHAQTTYRMVTRNYSPVTDSYPQEVSNFKKADSVYYFTVKVSKAYDDTLKRKVAEKVLYSPNDIYDGEVAFYLNPTRLIDYSSPTIELITDSLFKGEDSIMTIIKKGLEFVSHYISFDDSLATAISRGDCKTLDVNHILQRKKGTCSEYTNLFTALMRKKGIPCRFVAGFIFIPEQKFYGCHAWAECYLKQYGWMAVDPQSGKSWLPTTIIQLFAGTDYTGCGLNSFMDLVPKSIEIVKE
ncbi:transglutaminase-like domain-containing protein [Bacteroides fragilis]